MYWNEYLVKNLYIWLNVFEKFPIIIGVGPENWKPSPLHIKGPKPRPRSPIVRDTQ